MKISDVMTRNVEIVNPSMSIKDAASIMKRMNVGFLPVGDNDRLIGMVTDRDITLRATAEGKNPEKTSVKDVMTQEVQYCYETTDVKEAGKQMMDHQIRRLVVLNQDKRAVGVCSLGDIVVKGEDTFAGRVLEDISKPAKPNR